MDWSSGQKTNKESKGLNDTSAELGFFDLYRAFHPKAADYTFFSRAHWTFSRIAHMLGHKPSLGKFNKIEIIWSFFSDHNAMRLEVNYKK